MIAPILLKLRTQYFGKRNLARRDGIQFALSLQQYIQLALNSNQADNIGYRKGQYNFCRRDHSLGYTLANTFVGSAAENNRERHQRCGTSPKSLQNLQKRRGKSAIAPCHTPQSRAKAAKTQSLKRIRFHDKRHVLNRLYQKRFRDKQRARQTETSTTNDAR